MTDEMKIEAEIQEKGLNAPRLTPEHVSNTIVAEYVGRASDLFHDAPAHESLQCLTIGVCVLKNGFTVIGTSACASPENFNAEIGNRIALSNAREKVWGLEGYLLRERLHEESAK